MGSKSQLLLWGWCDIPALMKGGRLVRKAEVTSDTVKLIISVFSVQVPCDGTRALEHTTGKISAGIIWDKSLGKKNNMS